MNVSSAFVCLLGMGTVFFGLICIVALCYLMSALCRVFEKNQPETQRSTPAAPVAPATINTAKVENKQEIIAAVACAVAEELGTDVEGIRIKSFRKL